MLALNHNRVHVVSPCSECSQYNLHCDIIAWLVSFQTVAFTTLHLPWPSVLQRAQ